MKKIYTLLATVLLILPSVVYAQDVNPHTCAVVTPNGHVMMVVTADPNSPDNDSSPITGDSLVIADGTGVQVGCYYINGSFSCPTPP